MGSFSHDLENTERSEAHDGALWKKNLGLRFLLACGGAFCEIATDIDDIDEIPTEEALVALSICTLYLKRYVRF